MRIENKEEAILAIQSYLYELGLNWDWLPSVYPSGNYGEQTQEAVRAFQGRFDLPVTGEVDFATWTLLYLAYRDAIQKRKNTAFPVVSVQAFPLEIGSRGDDVSMLRSAINALGAYYPTLPRLAPTSLYQYSTASAVRKLQGIYGLEQTGMVDIHLWNSIFSDLSSKNRAETQRNLAKNK